MDQSTKGGSAVAVLELREQIENSFFARPLCRGDQQIMERLIAEAVGYTEGKS